MSHTEPARSAARPLAVGLLALAALVGAVTLSPPAAAGEPDGAVPQGLRIADDHVPAVANLDPRLRRALRRAAAAAAADGIEIVLNGGWRSRTYQARLLREAVARHGSQRAAARWVATPDASPHVSGEAVDIGPPRAASWLARHGAAFGVCRVYRNEPWHFELRPAAVRAGCPTLYPDPRHDPRMQS